VEVCLFSILYEHPVDTLRPVLNPIQKQSYARHGHLAEGSWRGSVPSGENHGPSVLEPSPGSSPWPPCLRSSQRPSHAGRQPPDPSAAFRVAQLLLFTLSSITGIRLRPVLTGGIPRHRRHGGVLLPSWGSGQLVSPWVLLSTTFSRVGETWRETHCQAQVTRARNHPPASQARKEHLLLSSRQENYGQFCFLKHQRGSLPR